MKTGEKIKELRTSKGISQELLADNSGISLRTIQRIESGESVPRLYTLKTLAEHLSVPVEELTITDREPIKIVNAKEEISTIRLINASGLLVIILPVINIFISLVISRAKKINTVTNETVKRIISLLFAECPQQKKENSPHVSRRGRCGLEDKVAGYSIRKEYLVTGTNRSV